MDHAVSQWCGLSIDTNDTLRLAWNHQLRLEEERGPHQIHYGGYIRPMSSREHQNLVQTTHEALTAALLVNLLNFLFSFVKIGPSRYFSIVTIL